MSNAVLREQLSPRQGELSLHHGYHQHYQSLETFVRDHHAYIAGGTAAFSVVAVACGVLLVSLAPGSPHPVRHQDGGISTSTTFPPTVASRNDRIEWLGAPARLWQTCADQGDRIKQKSDVLLVPDFPFDGPTINITEKTGQTIAGFGGAFSEATARVFRELPPDEQHMVLEGYFGRGGIGYTLGRVDVMGDFNPDNFADDILRDKRVQIPLVKAAQEVLRSQGKELRLLATQWSPPPWMRTNAKMIQPAHPCIRKMVSKTWAQYFVQWVTAYHQQGVPIWAVTVQHESEKDNDARLEACLLTPEEEANFLGKMLGPKLRASHPDVQVFFSHHGNHRGTRWSDLIRSHPVAAMYAVGFAFQGGTVGGNLEAIREVRKEMPTAQLLASEAVGLRRRWRWHEGATLATGEWHLGEGYARDIMGALNVGSIGWIDWNLLINDERIGPIHVDNIWDAAMNLMVDDREASHEDNVWDAAMMADLSTGEVYRHPQYYFIGHFSRFIVPGSVHKMTTISPNPSLEKGRGSEKKLEHETLCNAAEGLKATSFLRPDGLLVTVVLNCGDRGTAFKLVDGRRAARASIPPHAIQTYLFDHKSASPFRTPGEGGAPFLGCNLGGWLLLEDWMWAPKMTEMGIHDEWTLIKKHGGPRDPRAVALMEGHWRTAVTEEDLDRLLYFGVTHVRVPIGWWLVDYDPEDGFVDGGEVYLRRLLTWLAPRGMRALLDLHALPGAQANWQGYTGRRQLAKFFTVRSNYERGKRAMLNLAQLIVRYEHDPATTGVVFGMELVNEPDWKWWGTSPGIRELYEDMVPQIRLLLPSYRYAIVLNFMESPRTTGANWLASMRQRDLINFAEVIYDAHMYHSYGDDNRPGRVWHPKVDSCKTCCRDPYSLQPMVDKGVPLVVGEFSLNTGFPGNDPFYLEYLRDQLSLFATTPGMVGSFFWSHRLLRDPGGWFKEMSFLDLLAPTGPIPPASQMNLTVRCPGKDLSLCPTYSSERVLWNDPCKWRGDPDPEATMGVTHERKRETNARMHKGING